MSEGWRIVRGIVLALVPLSLLVGWLLDRWGQVHSLQRLDFQFVAGRKEVDEIQERLYLHQSFNGFSSAEEVLDAIHHTESDDFYAFQIRCFPGVTDEVYEAATRQVIELMGSRDKQTHERAWQLLEVARQDDRFAVVKSAYIDGLAEMLRKRSIPNITTDILAWLVREKIKDDAIRRALTAKMNDDHDPQAPFAAYTLAKLHPDIDIGPRLVEMIEREHEGWIFIVFELPKYMPNAKAEELQKKYRGAYGDWR